MHEFDKVKVFKNIYEKTYDTEKIYTSIKNIKDQCSDYKQNVTLKK